MINDAKLKTKPIGMLIIVGTPIGNSMDLSPRGIEAFENANLVLSEDTRVTKKLSKIRGFKIKKLIPRILSKIPISEQGGRSGQN